MKLDTNVIPYTPTVFDEFWNNCSFNGRSGDWDFSETECAKAVWNAALDAVILNLDEGLKDHCLDHFDVNIVEDIKKLKQL